MMIDTIWQDILTKTDQQVIDAAGYRTRGASTFTSRGEMTSPALLIIDMQVLFVGDDVPVLDAIAIESTMIGERGWRAIDRMLPLIESCRQKKLPVIYAKMMPHNRPVDDSLLNIVEPLVPQAKDTIIEKSTSSVFFNTELADTLKEKGIDSLIIVGNSTSGCIRAATVDAVQYGLTPLVPYDCVFDRIEASHKIALLDMWMKYAIVTSSDDIMQRVNQLEVRSGGVSS